MKKMKKMKKKINPKEIWRKGEKGMKKVLRKGERRAHISHTGPMEGSLPHLLFTKPRDSKVKEH